MKTLIIHVLVLVISCIGIVVVENEVLRGAFAGAIATELLFLVTHLVERRRELRLVMWSAWFFIKSAEVYISVSALVRIRSNDRYLLVYSKDRAQYHPLGGALHWAPDVKAPFPYEQVVKAEENRKDMRFVVTGWRLHEVIEWVCRGRDREMSPWRELYEELVAANVVEQRHFPFIATRFIRRVIEGPRGNPKRGRYELRVFEIHDAALSDEQLRELQCVGGAHGEDAATEPHRPALRWFTKNEIEDGTIAASVRVGDHTRWLMDD